MWAGQHQSSVDMCGLDRIKAAQTCVGWTGSKQCRHGWAGQDQSSGHMWAGQDQSSVDMWAGQDQCRHVWAGQDQSRVDIYV